MLEHVPMDLLRRPRLLAGATVLPRETDTALAKGNGNGGRYINLNTTRYAQPRRVLWATLKVREHTDEDGDRVIGCLCYPHLYRKASLLQYCEAMPQAVDDLITFALRLAQPWLTTASRAERPNSCELLIYYTTFQSTIGRHRDNFVSQDLCMYLQTRNPSVLGRQRNKPQREHQCTHLHHGQCKDGAAVVVTAHRWTEAPCAHSIIISSKARAQVTVVK